MEIGVSLRSGYAVADVRQGARWMVERARAARDAGLDSLFLGDHHVAGGAYYQNVPMLGRLLTEWGDRTYGALFLLPLWHPVLLAEQVGTLAALGEGRLVLQAAVGAGEEQFAGMGHSLRNRGASFEARLGTLRRLLAGEAVSADRLVGARTGPRPPQPVDVWIGAGAEKAIDRAARLGEGWVAGPWLTAAAASEQLAYYRERCEAHGRRGFAVIRRDIHVGADAADASRVAGPVLSGGYRGFEPGVAVVGGPHEVAESFADLAERGFAHVLVRHLVDDQAEVLASFDRLAEVRRLLAR